VAALLIQAPPLNARGFSFLSGDEALPPQLVEQGNAMPMRSRMAGWRAAS
jgi:hypothetical protein